MTNLEFDLSIPNQPVDQVLNCIIWEMVRSLNLDLFANP